MILLDTSVLVEAFTFDGEVRRQFRDLIERGGRLSIPSLVLYEWLRGPRRQEDLALLEALFPVAAILPFGSEEAACAARLFGSLPRARQREFDLGIAAVAIVRQAPLWTLNVTDFRDIPGLQLHRA